MSRLPLDSPDSTSRSLYTLGQYINRWGNAIKLPSAVVRDYDPVAFHLHGFQGVLRGYDALDPNLHLGDAS